jgi:hypothetical protein
VRPSARARDPQALLSSIPRGAAAVGRGVGAEAQPVRPGRGLEVVEHHPGSTVALAASGSSASTRPRCRPRSTTTPGPTALPAIEAPAPLAVTGTPTSRQVTTTAASASSRSRGKTTSSGGTRYSEASVEYSARRLADALTSATRPTAGPGLAPPRAAGGALADLEGVLPVQGALAGSGGGRLLDGQRRGDGLVGHELAVAGHRLGGAEVGG